MAPILRAAPRRKRGPRRILGEAVGQEFQREVAAQLRVAGSLHSPMPPALSNVSTMSAETSAGGQRHQTPWP